MFSFVQGEAQTMEWTEKQIIELAAEKAAKVTLETLKQQKKKEREERRDWRLRNTRLLLEHLQEFKQHSDQSIFDVRKVLESSQEDVAAYSQQISERQDVYVTSIMLSAGRTATLIEDTERMLNLYRMECEQGSEEKQRRYRVLIACSIQKKSYQQIMEEESISRSTVFRDIETAIEELSAMIFGADIFYDFCQTENMGKTWESREK